MNRITLKMAAALAGIGLASAAAADYRSTEVTVTAYNAVPAQTDSTPWIGACNVRLRLDQRPVAVSRDLFAQGLDCGAEVALEGEDESYVVMDKMHSRHSRRIDVFMGRDVDGAREFGVEQRRIWWYDDT